MKGQGRAREGEGGQGRAAEGRGGQGRSREVTGGNACRGQRWGTPPPKFQVELPPRDTPLPPCHGRYQGRSPPKHARALAPSPHPPSSHPHSRLGCLCVGSTRAARYTCMHRRDFAGITLLYGIAHGSKRILVPLRDRTRIEAGALSNEFDASTTRVRITDQSHPKLRHCQGELRGLHRVATPTAAAPSVSPRPPAAVGGDLPPAAGRAAQKS